MPRTDQIRPLYFDVLVLLAFWAALIGACIALFKRQIEQGAVKKVVAVSFQRSEESL